jgi:hypothetical protein
MINFLDFAVSITGNIFVIYIDVIDRKIAAFNPNQIVSWSFIMTFGFKEKTLKLSPDAAHLFATNGVSNIIKINAGTGVIESSLSFFPQMQILLAIDLSPDSKYLAIGGQR